MPEPQEPEFAVSDLDVTVAQVDAPRSDGLYLAAGQDHSRLVGLLDEVVVVGLAVGSNNLLVFLHGCLEERALSACTATVVKVNQGVF